MKALTFQGNKLKKFRELKNYNLSELAERSGINQSTLSELENGKNKSPREATVNNLCMALDVDPIQFYFAGENFADLFPQEIPADVRNFVFDASNLPYLQLAMKMKDPSVPLISIENLLTQYLKSAKMILEHK